jgi:uncharacterized delta-60 repeat protein|tara:strand:- start:264541 stop:266037 length:1497 start_codon:yes stop_codon:yes gene_type:complete
MRKIILNFFLSFLFSTFLFAQDGSLDFSFGEEGVVEVNIPFGPLGYTNQKTIELADGSYISYFQINMGSGSLGKNVLVKLLNNGDLDTSFGTDGFLDFPSLDRDFYYQEIWEMPNGKLLISDLQRSGSLSSNVLRQLNSDGSIDVDFGTNGVVMPFSGKRLVKTEIDSNGRIIAVGGKPISQGLGLQFKRYLSNGQIDTSFGVNGVANATFANEALIVRDFKLLSDGSMFVASSIQNFNGAEDLLLITKHHPNGSLDLSFSQNGIVTSPLLFDYYNRVFLSVFDSEELIVSIVRIPGGTANGYNVAYKLTNTGNLDTTFATDGYLTANGIAEILIQSDQRFLRIVHDYGDPLLSPGGPFRIDRFFSNGIQDSSLSFQTDPNAFYDFFIDYFVDSTGKILVTAPSNTLDIYRLSNNPLGISENTNNDLVIFPNPTNGLLTLSCSSCELTGTPYMIVDTIGRIIWNGVFKINHPTIDISTLATGMYYLKTNRDDIKFIKK